MHHKQRHAINITLQLLVILTGMSAFQHLPSLQLVIIYRDQHNTVLWVERPGVMLIEVPSKQRHLHQNRCSSRIMVVAILHPSPLIGCVVAQQCHPWSPHT